MLFKSKFIQIESKIFDWNFIFCTENIVLLQKQLKNVWKTQRKIIISLIIKIYFEWLCQK